MKTLILALGLHSEDRKSTRDKSNIGDPKVNRGRPPLTSTAPQQTEMKIHLDTQYNILHWGSTMLEVATLWAALIIRDKTEDQSVT